MKCMASHIDMPTVRCTEPAHHAPDQHRCGSERYTYYEWTDAQAVPPSRELIWESGNSEGRSSGYENGYRDALDDILSLSPWWLRTFVFKVIYTNQLGR